MQVPDLAAEEVEKQITIPLEREIMGTPGMYVMRSKSTFGLSLITVVFQDGAEDYWSHQRLQERIGGVTLPHGAQPGLADVSNFGGITTPFILQLDPQKLIKCNVTLAQITAARAR